MAQRYAIADLAEAKLYLADPVSDNAALIAEAATLGKAHTASLSFPYDRNARYQLRTVVGAPGTIALQPGETLVNYAASNSELWVIDAAQVDDHTRLTIEPTRANLSTHLLINTDRRTYLVEATSQSGW